MPKNLLAVSLILASTHLFCEEMASPPSQPATENLPGEVVPLATTPVQAENDGHFPQWNVNSFFYPSGTPAVYSVLQTSEDSFP